MIEGGTSLLIEKLPMPVSNENRTLAGFILFVV